MNEEWHEMHPLPRHAPHEERVAWHVEHARVCGCREIPASVRADVEARQAANRRD